jgi:tetratricopeptide (TPR) repeat protein
VLHLKGNCRKLDEIARDLRVDGVVEGAVLHEGNRVRVTAQLILLEPERPGWAESYDCDTSSVLATQREAARAIAGCVGVAVGGSAPASHPPAPVRPVAPEILETYAKARVELGKMSADGIGKALQYLREVTTKAPDFAQGVAEHALCLGSLGFWGHAPIRETYPAAKQMALSALAIDDTLDSAHGALGFANWLLDWDLQAAERELRRAIELSPSNPDAHFIYAIFLSAVGRYSKAIEEIEYSLRLDITGLLANTAAAWIYLYAHKNERAEAQARRTIEAFPDSLHAHFVLGWAAWRRGGIEDAVAAFEKALSISREAFSLAFLGHIYGRLGRVDDARRMLAELEQLFSRGQAPPISFVMIHAGLGEADRAFEWLETAYRLRDDKLFCIAVFPPLDPLRSDPRFAALVRRMGLAAAASSAAS